jgi:hypothetical protein
MNTTLLNATTDQLQAECLRRAIHAADEHILRNRTALARAEQKQANRIRELARLSALIYQSSVSIAPDPGPIPLSTPSTPSAPTTTTTLVEGWQG